MIRAALFALCLILPLAGLAQGDLARDPGDKARQALAALELASQELQKAERARDRVQALTQTIHAFEAGLAAMREGLRQAAVQERALSAKLAAQKEEISVLLAGLQTMGRTDSPTIFLHPEGALGTARAGMIVSELSPILNARAQRLRRDLEDVKTLRALQNAASEKLFGWLNEVRQARTALNQAMAERENLPARFVTDPIKAAILIDSAETLAGFAEGLPHMVAEESAPALELTASKPIGHWDLPVRGTVLRAAGEADAAGVARPGIVLATRSGALATSPSAATIRYAGPLLDMGLVMILEPRADALLILAGLGTTYGQPGDVIEEGTPIGLMPSKLAENVTSLSEEAGTALSETLYIEIREYNDPVDPAMWFSIGPKR